MKEVDEQEPKDCEDDGEVEEDDEAGEEVEGMDSDPVCQNT